MIFINRFSFIGRLTADPEVRYTQDGKPVVRYRFAVNRSYKREGEPDADFFQITMFGNPAERFEKLNVRKGTKLLLEGEIRNNNYTDKDGVKHYDIQFNCFSFEFCESKNNAENGANSAPAQSYGQNPGQNQGTAGNAQNQAQNDGFMVIPDDLDDEGLPFV